MYPVYPELGWIHSVSSVSQLSEAAYTRRPNAFCAAAGAGVGVAAATIAAGAAAARAVAAGAGAGAGAGTRAVAPAPRRARSGFGLKGIGDGDLRSGEYLFRTQQKKTFSSSKPEAVYLTVYPLCIQTECGFTCILCV